MNYSTGNLNRRQFLSTAAAGAVPLFVSASVLGRTGRAAPSERITLGVVGLGGRGLRGLVERECLTKSDAQIVAVCDVDNLHYRDRHWGDGKSYGRQAAKELIEVSWQTRHCSSC